MTDRLRLALAVGALIPALLAGCSNHDDGRIPPPPPPGHRVWTILMYFDADNNLESALIKDFNEMEAVGTTEHVTMVAQMDRIAGYDTSNDNWTGTRRYLITKDPEGLNGTIDSELLEDLGEKNMGDEQTLREFIDWGMATYPADHYFLILSNHGAGWLPRSVRQGIVLYPLARIEATKSPNGSGHAGAWLLPVTRVFPTDWACEDEVSGVGDHSVDGA